MSANFQLYGNMPDAKDALKTPQNDGAKVPAHSFKIMGCILSGQEIYELSTCLESW